MLDGYLASAVDLWAAYPIEASIAGIIICIGAAYLMAQS